MCECCSRDVRNTMTAYTRVAIVIREKFIGPKILGIEVQGHKHGSFYIKTYKRIVRDCECLLVWEGSLP